MKTKIGITVLAFLFVALLSCGYAKARVIEVDSSESQSGGLFGNIGQSLNDLSKKVSDAVHNQMCAAVKTKIGTKAIWISGMERVHMAQYDSVRVRLTETVVEANANGYDTAKIYYDLASFLRKVNNFEDHFNEFKDKMDEAKSEACDNTNDQSRVKMREARALLRTVRNDAKEIKDFYNNEIKVDMLVLKQQKYKSEAR